MRPSTALWRASRLHMWRVAAALLVAAIALAACTSTKSLSATNLPSLTKSCRSTISQVGTRAIPFSEQTTTAGGPLVVVAVCVNGQGPYPFAVATGQGTSVVSPALKQSLKLPASASSATVLGATCQTTAPTTSVQSVSLAGISLAPQAFLVATVPGLGARLAPVGIIGSDVLARFGAVRVDYRTKMLTLARPERPAPSGNTIIFGQTGASPPNGFVKSGPELGVVLGVAESPTSALVSTMVSIAGVKESFIVDSGSSSSSIATDTASTLELSTGTTTAAKAGVGCTGNTSTYTSGSWTAGGAALPSTLLAAQTFAGPANRGLEGALGADVLQTYRSFIVDYGGAHLWLGVG